MRGGRCRPGARRAVGLDVAIAPRGGSGPPRRRVIVPVTVTGPPPAALLPRRDVSSLKPAKASGGTHLSRGPACLRGDSRSRYNTMTMLYFGGGICFYFCCHLVVATAEGSVGVHAAHSKPKTRSLLFCASSGSRVIMSLRAGIVHKATMTLAPFFFLFEN